MVKYGQIVRFNQLLMLYFLFSITYENDRQDKHVMFILSIIFGFFKICYLII